MKNACAIALQAAGARVGRVLRRGSAAERLAEPAAAHVRSLSEPHFLRGGAADADADDAGPRQSTSGYPLEIAPTTREFGWRPTPLREAVREYMVWLRLQPPKQQ